MCVVAPNQWHNRLINIFFLLQIRHRFGCYDEISGNGPRRVRHCNWVRFVRVAAAFNPAVNFVATKVRGEPVYEAVKTIQPDTELLVYYLPERPEELFFVRMRASLYRQTMDSILEGEEGGANGWDRECLPVFLLILFGPKCTEKC